MSRDDMENMLIDVFEVLCYCFEGLEMMMLDLFYVLIGRKLFVNREQIKKRFINNL